MSMSEVSKEAQNNNNAKTCLSSVKILEPTAHETGKVVPKGLIVSSRVSVSKGAEIAN